MNRREALKKIAAGGAVAATASVVVSQPAFAYDQPTPPDFPIVSAALSGLFGGQVLTLTFNPGTATCPGSATGGASVQAVAYTASETGPVAISATTGSGTSGPLSVSFSRFFFGAASATVTYRARYRCTYAGDVAERCKSWTYVHNAGTGFVPWQTTPSSIVSGTACP